MQAEARVLPLCPRLATTVFGWVNPNLECNQATKTAVKKSRGNTSERERGRERERCGTERKERVIKADNMRCHSCTH
jgi:hypothetical protein